MKKIRLFLTTLFLFPLLLTSCDQQIINEEFNLTKFDYDKVLKVDYDTKINHVYLKVDNVGKINKHFIIADIDRNLDKNLTHYDTTLRCVDVFDYPFYTNVFVAPLPLVYSETYVYYLKEALAIVQMGLFDYLEDIYHQFNDNFREIHEANGIFLD